MPTVSKASYSTLPAGMTRSFTPPIMPAGVTVQAVAVTGPGAAAVADHHHRFFAGHEITERHQLVGPISKRVPDFFVHEIGPGPKYAGWTYASVGVWEAVHSPDGHGLEFLLTAPERNRRLVELVAMTAYYHAGPAGQRLDEGHTVPIGEPWLPGSACDHLLVSLPYPFGAELESCAWSGGHARLLWLLPITGAERDYKVEYGLEALEQRLEEAAIHPTDVGRRSVV
ncbi:MAG: hypothetical protein QOD07_2354 [Frankiaceae bacterium]|nr:hypothetical protein [Frankiaceae bacterium]